MLNQQNADFTLTYSFFTHISVLIRRVVGEFELVESHRLGHPLVSGGRALWVDVHPSGHLRVGLARHRPPRVVELVAPVVRRHDVHQEDVLGAGIQPADGHFERRKHSSGMDIIQRTENQDLDHLMLTRHLQCI